VTVVRTLARQPLRRAVALTSAAGCADLPHPTRRAAPLTVNDGGPDRGTPPLRAKIGTGHVLTGVVLSTSCAPIAGARVSFCHSNAKGGEAGQRAARALRQTLLGSARR